MHASAAFFEPLQRRLDAAVSGWLDVTGAPSVDFSTPAGAPALLAPDSVTWRVMKNPIALIVGGIAAVMLELAEPRVAAGVWDHTTFRANPVGRMKRTGFAAMVTIYAPAEAACAMIAGVSRRHARIAGETADGVAYRAGDPELLDWVQATASFGFLQAYRRYARLLPPADCDRFFAEAAPIAALYGATGAPRTVLECEALLARMRHKLAPTPALRDFLRILRDADFLPAPLLPLRGAMIAAAASLLPQWMHPLLGPRPAFPPGGETMLRMLGAAGERIVLRSAPPAQACLRLDLGADYLYH